MGDFRRRR